MEGEVWAQDYKMKALVYLNKEGWVVKPLSACCVQLWLHAEYTDYIWLCKSGNSEKIAWSAQQTGNRKWIWVA